MSSDLSGVEEKTILTLVKGQEDFTQDVAMGVLTTATGERHDKSPDRWGLTAEEQRGANTWKSSDRRHPGGGILAKPSQDSGRRQARVSRGQGWRVLAEGPLGALQWLATQPGDRPGGESARKISSVVRSESVSGRLEGERCRKHLALMGLKQGPEMDDAALSGRGCARGWRCARASGWLSGPAA